MAADTALQRLEAALAKLEGARYELTLFVNGASSSSSRAIQDVQGLCEAHLDGRYDLTIVDVNDDPELAMDRRVLATPTLLKDAPAPERMLVGDLSDSDRVLVAFDLRDAHQVDAGKGR
ncbi:MAG: thiol-disulfide isomerase [Solirubrobacterales bacterium]|jgi:circadian clock protein KaiB|nr:thiol-disulfide isomerase [Solirubrobacterales bacterium]